MRKLYKGRKVKVWVSPITEEKIDHICEATNMDFVEAMNVMLNNNLEVWLSYFSAVQTPDPRHPVEKPRPGSFTIANDGKRYMK